MTTTPTTGPDTRLKYRIKALFILFYGTEAGIRDAKERLTMLPDEDRVSMGTIEWDINIRMVEPQIVAEHRLQRYARFFGVNVDYLKADLLEYQHRNVRTKVA